MITLCSRRDWNTLCENFDTLTRQMEYSRRCLLVSAVAASAGRLPGKDNFWTKPADEWTDKELHQLLTKSPWAKEVSAQFSNSGPGSPPMAGGSGGGRRGGG